MRQNTLRASFAALIVVPLLSLGLGSSASATSAAPVCDLPTLISSSPILSSTTGQQIATVQLRRSTVHVFLGSYYRYCSRIYLTRSYVSQVTGVATVSVQDRKGGPFVDSSAAGSLVYVAPTSPAFATAGLSSPIVDVHRGSVGYKASVRIAPPGN